VASESKSPSVAFAVEVPAAVAGATEDSATAQDSVAWQPGLHDNEGAVVVSERETGEVAGLRRLVKRKSRTR
jgi:hypothetical protein